MLRLLTTLSLRSTPYRARIIWGVVCIVCLVGYTALWFSQAHRLERFFAQSVATLPSVFPDAKIEASYGAIAVSGFPFSFSLAIDAPHMRYQDDRTQWEFDSQDRLQVAFSIWGRSLHIVLPKRSVLVRALPDGSHKAVALEYENAPNLTLRASMGQPLHWWQWFGGNMPEGLGSVWRSLSDVSYRDDGFALVDDESKYLLFKTTSNAWRFKARSEGEDKVRYAVDMATRELDVDASLLSGGQAGLGAMDCEVKGDVVLAANFSPSAVPQAEFRLASVALKNSAFEAAVSGDVHMVEDDVFPHGTLLLSISNDREFLAWLSHAPAFSEGFLGTVLHPQEKDISGWTQFLHYISESAVKSDTVGENSDDASSAIRIKLTRAFQGELWMGARSMEDVISAYRNFIGVPSFSKTRVRPGVKIVPEHALEELGE